MHSVFYVKISVNPPNSTTEQNADQIDQPHERNTDKEQYDCKYDTNNIALIQTTAQTIDHPNDCDSRDAENQLNELRKIIHCVNQAFHDINLFLQFSGILRLLYYDYIIFSDKCQ